MFDGPIIDVAVGLIFFDVVLSLICSASLRRDGRTLPYRWPKGRNVGTAIVEVRPVE